MNCNPAGGAGVNAPFPQAVQDKKHTAKDKIVIVIEGGQVVRFDNSLQVPHLQCMHGDGI